MPEPFHSHMLHVNSSDSVSRPRPPTNGPVLFDCDGLLLDTETCWTRAETALFAHYGRPFGVSEKHALLGASMTAGGLILERLLDQPDRAEALNTELLELVGEELARGAEPLPGAVALVAALQGRRPIAIVSNTPRRLLATVIAQAGFADAFDFVIGGDEVASAKPAPDLYLSACASFQADPATAIALEDSPTGVAAARAAGVFVIGVPSLASVVLDADLIAPSLEHPDVWRALRAQPRVDEA